MLSGKIGRVLALVIALGLLLAPMSYADVQVPTVTDGPQDAQLELPRASHRLIVELESPPAALWYATETRAAMPSGRLDVNSSAVQSYVGQLKAEQAAFVTSMRSALPSARAASYINELGLAMPLDYQLTFNGLTVDPGDVDREVARRTLSALPGVKAVYLDLAQHTDLYTSTALINAPVLWNQAGGQADAGAGVKVASMDGGIHHEAPMFSGEGWSYPPGYPPNGLGLASNNNGKIIASRVYFRDWDPPAPGDENPWPGVAGTPHGNHTSSIAAGNVVTATYANLSFPNMSGVAPGAWLMSYRVFYASVRGDGSFYNAEGIAALEDIVADGADVLNNSWGGGPTSVGGEFDALDTALINASKAGIFVSMSAGNAGPGGGTNDHPSPDYINVAATTTSGTLVAGVVSVTAPEPVDSDLQDMPYTNATFGPVPATGDVYTYPYVTSESVDPANAQGCSPWAAGSFTGNAALILRGTCDFSQKVYYAQEGGAEFVIIRNNADGDTLINMAAGAFAEQVTIPSIFIGQNDGEAMAAWFATYGVASRFTYDARAFQDGNVPDYVISFSSRGPGVGGVLKPDIAAPGVNILAQGYALGAVGEDRHLGWGQASGTSMAAPHVTGAAALLRQAHPDWPIAWIKSALMSTSKYLDIYDAYDGEPAQPLEIGAGRLDLTHAADPGVILDPPSLGYGMVPEGTEKAMSFTVTSVATDVQTYTLSTLYTGAGFAPGDLTDLPGFSVSPTTLTLGPGQSAQVEVTFDADTSAGIGDNQGYIILDGDDYEAHLPAWARVVPGAAAADVLVIQNDFNWLFGEPDFPDYLDYYTSTLQTLGVTWDVWNADWYFANPTTIPDPAVLSAYKAIVYFTGNNYYPDGTFTVSTPLTALDMDILTEYANAGGSVIAMGQDIASVLGAASYAPPESGPDVMFYGWLLGANYLQDSITDVISPTQPIVAYADAPAAFENVTISVDPEVGDGAGNQFYIDEISSLPPGEPVPPPTREYQPLLRYPSPYAIEDGGVAMAHRDQPSLERPGTSYKGRSIYTTFGLEGVNNGVAGTVTREELLGLLLEWAWDEPTAVITHTASVDTSNLTYFEAAVESEFGLGGVSYRWDFGDGSPYLGPFANNVVAHTYAECGTYTVRVEAVDWYGNVAIGTEEVQVDVCGTHRIYLPVTFVNTP